MKVVLVCSAIVCAIVAVSAPWAAPRVAAVLLAVIATVYFTTRFGDLRTRLPVAEEHRFEQPTSRTGGAPADLALLQTDLHSARSDAIVGRSARRFVATVAATRLRDHHGIAVHAPDARQRVEPMVSPELLALLFGSEPDPNRAPTRASARAHLRVDALAQLIEEVEHL